MLVRFIIVIQLAFIVFAAPTTDKIEEASKVLAAINENSFDESLNDTEQVERKQIDSMLLPDSFGQTVNYETLGGGFQGDMIFPEGFDPLKPQQVRGVAIAGPRAWPSGIVPYDLSYISSSYHKNMIKDAMNKLMYDVGTPVSGQQGRRPCVYFRERTSSDRYFVYITHGAGCSGTVGFAPGSNMQMTLNNPGCFYSGIIQHELLHILGFYHEQSRPDRDSYIRINWNSIQNGMAYNFERFQWGSQVENQGTPYDYNSIMHYDAYAFSKNGYPTISPTRAGKIGQRTQLSDIDIQEVRKYYKC